MRQEVGRLVHQVDAQLVVLDPGVDVHAADHHALRQRLHVAAEDDVALLVDPALVAPVGERVGRGGDHRHAELRGGPGDRGAQLGELVARLRDVAADAGADLDLRLQQLVGDALAEALAAARHEALGRRGDEVAALRVDQEVLLLDAERERWGRKRHGRGSALPEAIERGIA